MYYMLFRHLVDADFRACITSTVCENAAQRATGRLATISTQ